MVFLNYFIRKTKYLRSSLKVGAKTAMYNFAIKRLVFIHLEYQIRNKMISNKNSVIEDFYFRHPFTCMLAGPAQSGKTTLVQKIISQAWGGLVRAPPTCIIYCYSRWQAAYDEIKRGRAKGPSSFDGSSIIFNEGLPDLTLEESHANTLVVLDDLMSEAGRDKNILNLFTTDSHHKNISIIFVTHNIFSSEKYFRTISLNCQYIIITNNPRDRLQVTILGKQMFPGDSVFFTKAYNDAVTSKSYGYLLMDFTQLTAEPNRVQTGVFEGEERIIYRIK